MRRWWNIEPLWMIFEPEATVIQPALEEDVSPWELEKSRNRLQKQLEKVESGRWLPRVPFRLTGQAARELREAHELVHHTGEVIGDVWQEIRGRGSRRGRDA